MACFEAVTHDGIKLQVPASAAYTDTLVEAVRMVGSRNPWSDDLIDRLATLTELGAATCCGPNATSVELMLHTTATGASVTLTGTGPADTSALGVFEQTAGATTLSPSHEVSKDPVCVRFTVDEG